MTDPAVGAGDLEGRRRLLLEPCVPGDVDEEEPSTLGCVTSDVLVAASDGDNIPAVDLGEGITCTVDIHS